MKELKISGIEIKRDEDGLYCLNDLWLAHGAQKKNKVPNWYRLDETKALIEIENLKSQKCAFKKSPGRYGGTYVNKALVYDYAMWISPEFKSYVISVFDGHVTGAVKDSLDRAIGGIKMSMIDINEKINRASVHFDDVKACGHAWGKAGSDIRRAKKEAVSELKKLQYEIQQKLDF